jgi:hypothetical protein
MKILNICSHDHANFSHDNANALTHAGSICHDFKLHPHKFGYPSQSRLIKHHEVRQIVGNYDVVQIMHSCEASLRLVLQGKPKRIFVWHTGSLYRQGSDRLNAIFNPHVEKSFIALGEFAGLGAKNEIYSVGAIDTERLAPTKKGISTPLSIMHLPSKPEVKGTPAILEMMGQLTGSFDFQYKLDSCPYQENLDLMQESDIYIELFAPEQLGRPYGSWGITALEAAAMGKVVFTQHLTIEVYKEAYGEYPKLVSCRDEKDFTETLQLLIDNTHNVADWQKQTLNWVKKYHSYLATGQRLRKLFEIKS